MASALRNQFYVGQHRKVLSDAKAQKDGGADMFYYRSLICLGLEEQVIKQVGGITVPELQVLKLLATYRTASSDENREMVLEKVKESKDFAVEATANAPNAALALALLFLEAKNAKEALKYVHKAHESLEHLAVTVQIYLRIDRLDLAAKQVKAMQDIDDDDAITTLATAWLHIAAGGDKLTEAFQLLEELVQKFGSSVDILNTMAACQMGLKNWAKAFGYLKQARELSLSSKDKVAAETLINSIVCLQQLHKAPELVTRIIGELKAAYPSHPWIARYTAMESLFDKTAATYSAKK